MATSNSFKFGSIVTSNFIIEEAFQRCGFDPSVMSGWQTISARNSLNIMFSEWVNRGLNLFTVYQAMLDITPGQATYPLPIEIVDVLEMTAVTSQRKLMGTPFSSAGGIAANAFDGNPLTACTQTSPNGYISYDYGLSSNTIFYVGIQSNVSTVYTLNVEYSFNGTEWFNCYKAGPLNFTVGRVTWFVPNLPEKAKVWRIIETGGATLNIQEIYFNIPQETKLMTRISRAEYAAIPNKTQVATPSQFLVNRLINPPLVIYPTPDTTYTNFVYNYERQIEDVNLLTDNIPVPQRFFDAAAAGLASRLALKFAPEKFQLLKNEAEEAYALAGKEDVERVPLRLQINTVSFT